MIYPRSAWSPRHGIGHPTPRPQSRVSIHHAPERLLPDNPTPAQVAEQIRIMEGWHARTLTPTNPRISYQWIAVDQTADLWEGLGWGRIGAHVANHNTVSLGIVILGVDGDERAGRAATWLAIGRLVREGIRLGHLTPDVTFEPHRRRVDTECPGGVLARFVAHLKLEHIAEPLDIPNPSGELAVETREPRTEPPHLHPHNRRP